MRVGRESRGIGGRAAIIMFGKKTKVAFFDRDRRCRRRLKRRKVGGETRRRREIRARRGRRGARDRLAGAGSSRRLGGRTGNAAYSPDQSVRSTARSSPARPIGRGSRFSGASVKREARCLGGGFRRGNARAVRVRTKTSLGVLARGGDGGDAPPLSGERSREYGPPRLAWSASAMFALPVRVIAGGRTASGGGGVGQSRKGRRKYKTM